MEKVLIVSVANIKEITVLNENIYDKLIRVEVVAVQDANVEPEIGTVLFRKIIELIKTSTLYSVGNEKYAELVDDYLVNIISNFTVANMPQLLQHQISNTGVNDDLPPNAQKAQEAVLSRLTNKYKDRAELYVKRCKDFIKEKGISVYPEYWQNVNVSEIKPAANAFRCAIHLRKKS